MRVLEAQVDSHPREEDEFAGFVDSHRFRSRVLSIEPSLVGAHILCL